MGGRVRLVQLQYGSKRRVAMVDEPHLRLLRDWSGIYGLAQTAITQNVPLTSLVEQSVTEDTLRYDPIYFGESEWRLRVPIDHPDEPASCLVSGTGLTHLGSAANRNTMHLESENNLTDSMKMFRWGVEGGHPGRGVVGVAPEWFYKGNGTILRAPGDALVRPSFAEDGGEEGEVAGVYLVAPSGEPRRIGMCIGNEFADHRFERKNYLNLAGSKLRTCSLGPELVVDPDFGSVGGTVRIERGGQPLWSTDICTGEAEMCHSLQNIEHHHFKFDAHRRPGDVHVHYFGACSLSFGAGIELVNGDIMAIGFAGFGRPLRNPIRIEQRADTLITARPLA